MAVSAYKIPVRQYYTLLSRYMRPQGRRVAALCVLILGGIVAQLATPQIMRFFIDTATQGGAVRILVQAAAAYMAAALIQQVLSVAATYIGENVGWTATNTLREDLTLHCLGLDMSFHKKHTPGEMIERLDEDVTSLANFFSQFTIRVLGNVLIVAGVLIMLFREDYRVGLVMTGFVALTMMLLQIARRRALPSQREARQASAELSGYIEERLAGTEDIRANAAEAHVMRGLYRQMRNRNEKQLRANLISNSIQATALTMHVIGIILALTAGILLARAGLKSVGTAYLFIYYTDMIFRPIMQITRQMEDFQRAGAGIQRIQDLSVLKSEIPDGSGRGLPAGPLAVEFQSVSFRYERDDEAVLSGISLRLAPGETLGLLGRTGSGKTTLTRLLSRLYDYDGGSINLGGVDLRSVPIREIRRRVGLVTQDVQLFHATVRDNVTFFDPGVPDAAIESVLKELGLWSWFLTLPQGLDTMLLGSGSGLSAGEAQLLALSRVFLRDPGLVIMDEASSRLDPVTENLLERAVDRLLIGRTGIIVAHRLRTVERVDQILILEDGGIREYGERERLAADNSSYFRRLLQTGLEEVMA